jgi:hypothetical protein
MWLLRGLKPDFSTSATAKLALVALNTSAVIFRARRVAHARSRETWLPQSASFTGGASRQTQMSPHLVPVMPEENIETAGIKRTRKRSGW